jgi:hypothetical protein
VGLVGSIQYVESPPFFGPTSFISYVFRWEDNIEMDVQEVGGGRGDWMELAQDRDR